MNNPFLVCIYGPTGVGKSDVAERLADQIPAEIINMDIGQCYEPLTIGTAKPAWRTARVAHHLFDVLQKPEHYSVTQYRQVLIEKAKEIIGRGNIPIVVGGSGFYLYSYFFPPTAAVNQQEPSGVDLESLSSAQTSEAAWQLLHTIDPARALHIDRNDRYRIMRALTIWERSGIKPSACTRLFTTEYPAYVLHVVRDRADLYERINKRVEHMMVQGWAHEVQLLRNTAWEPFLKAKKLIGYNELLLTPDDPHIIATIAQRTRHYAKRQMTFWRMIQKKMSEMNITADRVALHEVNLTATNLDLYIKQLSKQLISKQF